jgi:hypothetical protein
LLGDLFGTSGVTRLDAAFGADHMRLKHARKLRNLLNRGLKVGSWSDAEEMLDALDTAARTSDPTAASRRLVDRHITAAFPGDEPNAAAVAHFARYGWKASSKPTPSSRSTTTTSFRFSATAWRRRA